MSARLLAIAAIFGALTGACVGDESDADEVEPPPLDEVFEQRMEPIDVNADGKIDELDDLDGDGQVETETRYYFRDATFEKYCVVPDADSFDDFEEPRFGIPRGTTPVTDQCEADGIATGPMHDQLYPSKWCKKADCGGSPSGSGTGVGNEY